MISVIQTYRTVRELCNKEQKGFVTPEVFSQFAAVAQQNIFNEMFIELIQAKQARRSGSDPGRDKSLYKRVEEDLAYFIYEIVLSDEVAEIPVDETDDSITYQPADDGVSVFIKPVDLAHIISIRTEDTPQTSLELVYNSETAERILQSNLSSPTTDFPVAVISSVIEVLPEDVNNVILKYYRLPRSLYTSSIGDQIQGRVDRSNTPVFSALGTNSDLLVPNLLGCRDFELPGRYYQELISEIAKLIGIRLRDNFLTTIYSSEEKSE